MEDAKILEQGTVLVFLLSGSYSLSLQCKGWSVVSFTAQLLRLYLNIKFKKICKGHWVLEGGFLPTFGIQVYLPKPPKLCWIWLTWCQWHRGSVGCFVRPPDGWDHFDYDWVLKGSRRPVNVCCSSQNHFMIFFLIVMENNTFPKSKAATVFLRSYRSTLVKILHLIRELHLRTCLAEFEESIVIFQIHLFVQGLH